MLRQIAFSVLLIMFATVAQASVYASVEDRLAEFISDEFYSLDNAFIKYSESNPNIVAEDWMLRRFWLRVRAKFGIEVPGLAEFDVIPEVEMLWENQTPEGYEIYKP